MRLTGRDRALFGWLARLRYLCTSLVSRFVFGGRVKVARRRLRLLSEHGYIYWFERVDVERRGRLERVWYLSKRKKAELGCLLGLDTLHFYQCPSNPLFVLHHLKIAEFVLCVQAACDAYGRYSLQFVIENEHVALQQRSCLPLIGVGKGGFVPDALLVLSASTKDGVRKSLAFVEVDMGSMPLGALAAKLRAYLDFGAARGFAALRSEFGFAFSGFRLLLVVPSELRLRHVAQLCEEQETKGVVWLSTVDNVAPDSVLGPVWTVPDSERSGLQALVQGGGAC